MFAANVVMVATKALVIDIMPSEKQEEVNAWAGRVGAFGHVIGFFVGQVDLVPYFPFLGNTQLQVASVLSGIILFITQGITIYCVREAPLSDQQNNPGSCFDAFSSLITMPSAFKRLPKRIKLLCWIHFVAWLGWFPFLFFTTTWIGETYRRNHPFSTESVSTTQKGNLDEEATRHGTLALFWSGVVMLVTLLVAPSLIASRDQFAKQSTSMWGWFRTTFTSRPDLITLYALSHLLFGISMTSTVFVTSSQVLSGIFIVLGLAQALGSWAPYALVSPYFIYDRFYFIIPRQLGEAIRDESDSKTWKQTEDGTAYVPLLPNEDRDDGVLPVRAEVTEQSTGVEDQAGSIIGIMNTFVVLPQFVMIGVSSLIFTIFEPGRSVIHSKRHVVDGVISLPRSSGTDEGGVDALGLIFRIGGVAAFGAFYLTVRLARGTNG
ncbi:hypothetical protein FRB99_001850 [Tulasnella sp. 403]|nr:hypothetical protein FRB99_001850 [Tulasnella sp. 403]